tara:strand:+ start:3138 stop:3494 length:357 start_codon:yes stop_codon:yes gene_type:complete
MPNYRYRHPETGEEKVLFMSMTEMWDKTKGEGIEIDGLVWERDIVGEHSRQKPNSKGWPLYSDAAGTHPDEIPKAMEEMRRKGVNLNYTSDGRAIFENASQRRRAFRAMGLQDMQGYD